MQSVIQNQSSKSRICVYYTHLPLDSTIGENGTIILYLPETVTLKVVVSFPARVTAVIEYSPLSLGS